jgi:hypothetical protein
LLALLAASTAAPEPAPDPAPPWTDSPLARLEALALIQTLNADILSSPSATLILEQWCRDHGLAPTPVIVARRLDEVAESAPTASPEVRHDLDVTADETVRYRRVALTCGEHVLSIADNWYVPARLTAPMNQLLETTQTPFGKVVLPLKAHRETISMQLLWSALPDGWEHDAPEAGLEQAGAALALPPALFEHRAILYTPGHQAIAEVHEVYQRDLLAFAQPRLP